ncbi:Relaxin Receptor 1 [Manis pentadactyla]|nr:Relaxin Receptor 1 [Manis pentadactyla]
MSSWTAPRNMSICTTACRRSRGWHWQDGQVLRSSYCQEAPEPPTRSEVAPCTVGEGPFGCSPEGQPFWRCFAYKGNSAEKK